MAKICKLVVLVIVLIGWCQSSSSGREIVANSSEILKTLDRNHPRLMLKDEDLSEGNGLLQMWTYLAIICGMSLGGSSLSVFRR